MPTKAHGTIYPISALRAMALCTQRLTTPNGTSPAPTPDALVDLVAALGCVQIDTLQVVHRAHYVALWTRLGPYNTNDLDKLIYTAGQRRLYEGWGHAASVIPLEHHRYHRWRTDTTVSYNPGFREWLSKEGNRQLAAQTLERIRSEGGLRVADLEHSGPRPGAWYDWKPPKMALEALAARRRQPRLPMGGYRFGKNGHFGIAP